MSTAPFSAESLLDSAPCGLVLTDTDGTIRDVNATFCGWIGYDCAQLNGVLRFPQLLPVGGRVFHQTHWGPLLQMQGSVAEVKVEVMHCDGRRIPMLLNAVRHMHGSSERHQLALMIVSDRHKYERELLTARNKLREVNEQLSHANRQKTEFLATLAHELRNPLAPIRNGLQILKCALKPDEAARTRDMMERQLNHMVRLIDDLLDVSRIANGKLELRTAPVTLRQVVDAAVETSMPVIDAGRQRFVMSLADEPIYLDADLTRLSQVLSNILNNAAKFTPAGGEIALSVERDGSDVVLRIRDTGIGIAPDKVDQVFDMFGQVESTLERSQGGLGIGLALARTLTEMHGGRIRAESGGIGHGSTFVVRLPTIAPRAAPVVTTEQRAAGRTAKLRVLVTDDMIDNAESIQLLLQIEGHDVEIATSGRECLEKATSFHPDVVLLDVGLPDINGYEVARRLRADPHGKRMTLAAVTGWGSQEDRRLSASAGFDRHFTKPVAFEELIAFLAEKFGE